MITQVGKMQHQATSEDYSQYFKDAEVVVSRMQRLLVNLLALVRNDKGALDTDIKPVDLHVALSHYSDLIIADSSSKTLKVLADEALLTAILDNLMSNAREYGKGNITASFTEKNNLATLSVCNLTEHLQVDDLDHMSEPFWRKDSSRTDNSHLGLGLSLVQSYCSANDWSVEFSISDSRLFCVVISGIKMV